MKRLTGTCGEAVVDEASVVGRGESAQNHVASVARVVEQRMSDMLHVDAYLMGAACLKHAFDHAYISERFDSGIVGDGMFPVVAFGKDRHLKPVFQRSAYIAFDASVGRGGLAPHHCYVFAFSGLVEKLFSERCLGVGSLGHNEQS